MTLGFGADMSPSGPSGRRGSNTGSAPGFIAAFHLAMAGCKANCIRASSSVGVSWKHIFMNPKPLDGEALEPSVPCCPLVTLVQSKTKGKERTARFALAHSHAMQCPMVSIGLTEFTKEHVLGAGEPDYTLRVTQDGGVSADSECEVHSNSRSSADRLHFLESPLMPEGFAAAISSKPYDGASGISIQELKKVVTKGVEQVVRMFPEDKGMKNMHGPRVLAANEIEVLE